MRDLWRIVRAIPVIVAVSVVVGCDPVDRRISFDPAADFAAYRTYTWHVPIAMEPAAADAVYNPVVNQRIRDAVDRALAAKGLAEGLPADLSISITTGSERGQSVHYVPDVPRPLRWRNSFGAAYAPGWRPIILSYTAGIVAIDIFDTATGRPVWHGAAEKLIDEDDTSPEAIQAIVDTILADFPPARLAAPAGTTPAPTAPIP